jgi:hypothetical protein
MLPGESSAQRVGRGAIRRAIHRANILFDRCSEVLLAYHRSCRCIIGHCRGSPATDGEVMRYPRLRGLFRQAPF